jgi:hypothetical protein
MPESGEDRCEKKLDYLWMCNTRSTISFCSQYWSNNTAKSNLITTTIATIAINQSILSLTSIVQPCYGNTFLREIHTLGHLPRFA